MDDARFERLYRDHAPAVFAFLAYRTADRSEAEDLLAEVFERALRAGRGRTALIRDDRAWIFTIAVNRWRDHQRREQVRREAVAQAAHGLPRGEHLDLADELADRDRLARALAELSQEEQETVALRFGADLSLQQIAVVTHTSATTTEGRLYRALRKLRQSLTAETEQATEPQTAIFPPAGK